MPQFPFPRPEKMSSEATATASPEQLPKLLETKGSAVKELAEDPEIQKFFGLDEGEIKAVLSDVGLSTEGLIISPQFQSPGFGDAIDRPLIKVSDLETTKASLKHELKHGLHYAICKSLFEAPNNAESFQLLVENVLGDEDFINYLRSKGNEKQKTMFASIEALANEPPSPNAIGDLSWKLGALTYQHAFFVDPGLCESAASFKDEGHLLIVDWINHAFGAMIPGDQYLDGYGNKEYQETFKNASPGQKALLIRKSGYSRWKFFGKYDE